MRITATKIPDVLVLEPQVFDDDRGFFFETFREVEMASNGINHFVQENHSGSQYGVLRGLHFQVRFPQGKLVRVIRGEIFDVAVDLRKESPTFGQWVGASLSEKNKLQLWMPPGFAHGFLVLSNWAELIYKVTEYYSPEWERTLLWNDKSIGITWPILDGENPILSKKDSEGLSFSNAIISD